MDYAYSAIGLLTGVICGFLGVGGGLIIVPALIILFNLSPREAVATSLLAIFIISLSSVLTHNIHGSIRIRKGIILGLSGAIGVYAGAEALKQTEQKTFSILFSILLLYTALKMFNSALKRKQKDCAARKEKENIAAFFIAGLISGILSGFFGVGGGILMVPFMCFYAGYEKHIVAATSSIAILIISFSGIAAYAQTGAINYSLGLSLGIMGAIGSFIGALAMNLLQKWERKNNKNYDVIFYFAFGILMLFTTAKMLFTYVF